MKSLWRSASWLGAALLAVSFSASAQNGPLGRPGSVNYVEGLVTLDGQPVTGRQVGRVEVDAGHVLNTSDGKAEMLLTPGVFLRLDSASAVRMISPDLTDTRVELLTGKAMVEADLVQPENHLEIDVHGAKTVLDKKGLYEFTANPAAVAVYDGKVVVVVNDRTADVGKGHRLAFDNNPKLRAESFNRDATDNLYAWSSLRSSYVAQANMESAQTIVVNNPGWWYGTGWYWNPWFSSWAFVPGGGYFYNPFGFAFYSPAYWGWHGGIYRGVGFRYAGRGYAAAPAFRSFGGFHAMGGHFSGGRR